MAKTCLSGLHLPYQPHHWVQWTVQGIHNMYLRFKRSYTLYAIYRNLSNWNYCFQKSIRLSYLFKIDLWVIHIFLNKMDTDTCIVHCVLYDKYTVCCLICKLTIYPWKESNILCVDLHTFDELLNCYKYVSHMFAIKHMIFFGPNNIIYSRNHNFGVKPNIGKCKEHYKHTFTANYMLIDTYV